MPYRHIYVLVEGDDDERFVRAVVEPLLSERYDAVEVVQYAQKPRRFLRGVLGSIGKMGADYLYLADRDEFPCVSAKKASIVEGLELLDPSRVFVAVTVIEGWYLAGITEEHCRRLGLLVRRHTDSVTEGWFTDHFPHRFASRIDLLVEMLKCFDLDTATAKNRSFKYLIERLFPEWLRRRVVPEDEMARRAGVQNGRGEANRGECRRL